MDDSCTCKYVYEGNVRKPLIRMLSVPAGSTFVHSFYAKLTRSVGDFHDSVRPPLAPLEFAPLFSISRSPFRKKRRFF